MNLIETLNFRYATKKFDATRTIPAEIWGQLEQSLVLTPSSFGLQPWKFLIVTDAAVREQLVPHSWGQRQVADASHLVVFTVRKHITVADVDHYIASILATRPGATVESLAGLRGMMAGFVENPPPGFSVTEWATRQAYIALGQFMLSAATLGVDTCPMEGFVAPEYDKILGLEAQGLTAAVLCPVGYRAADDKYATLPKVRFPASEMVAHI